METSFVYLFDLDVYDIDAVEKITGFVIASTWKDAFDKLIYYYKEKDIVRFNYIEPVRDAHHGIVEAAPAACAKLIDEDFIFGEAEN